MNITKGIAYFKDGHTEEIRQCMKFESTGSIMFHTLSGTYFYDKQIMKMESGYLYIRHVFTGEVDGRLGEVPIDHIELL